MLPRLAALLLSATMSAGCITFQESPAAAVYHSGETTPLPLPEYLLFLENDGVAAATVMGLAGSGFTHFLFDGPWEILHPTGAHRDREPVLRKFIQLAHEEGIRVEAVYGNSDYGQKWSWVDENIVSPFLDYQQTRPENERFDAFHYDVEFWLLSDYSTNKFQLDLEFLLLLDRTRTRLDSATFAIPLHAYLTHHLQTNIVESTIRRTDVVHVATAADTAPNIAARARPALLFASTQGKGVWVNVAVSPPPPDEGPTATFHGQTITEMAEQLTAARELINSDPSISAAFRGFSVHNRIHLKLMAP